MQKPGHVPQEEKEKLLEITRQRIEAQLGTALYSDVDTSALVDAQPGQRTEAEWERLVWSTGSHEGGSLRAAAAPKGARAFQA